MIQYIIEMYIGGGKDKTTTYRVSCSTTIT